MSTTNRENNSFKQAYKQGYCDGAEGRLMDDYFKNFDGYVQGYNTGGGSLIHEHPDPELIAELKAHGVEDYEIDGFLQGIADAKAGHERRHNSKDILGYDVAYDMVRKDITRKLTELSEVIKEMLSTPLTEEEKQKFVDEMFAEDDDWSNVKASAVTLPVEDKREVFQPKPNNMFLKILGFTLTGCFIAVVCIFMRSKSDGQSGSDLPALKHPASERALTYAGLHFIKNNNRWGLADDKGETVIPPKYDSVTSSDNQYFLPEFGAYVMQKNRWGFVNGAGREVIAPKYIELGAFNANEVAWYVSENGDGLINAKGVELQTPEFDYVESDGWRFKIRKGDRWGLLDGNGNIIFPASYSSIMEENGKLALKKDGRYGLADPQGNFILRCEFDQIKPLADRFLVKKGDQFGVYDQQGKEVVPCEYDLLTTVENEPYYYVFKNGRSGYCDLEGNEVVPCEYQEAFIEGAGYVKIVHFGLIGWYDMNAHAMAIPLQYDFVWGKFESKNDVVKVRKLNGDVVRIDYYGREVTGKSLRDYYKQLVN